MVCTSGSVTIIEDSKNQDGFKYDDISGFNSSKMYVINHIRSVNVPAKILVIFLVFALVTKSKSGIPTSGMCRQLLILIAALGLFGTYVYSHMWRNDERIAMFYNEEFDTLNISPDNVVLIFGIFYALFAAAFYYISRCITSDEESENTVNVQKTKNYMYLLLAWAVIISLHHFWAFFA